MLLGAGVGEISPLACLGMVLPLVLKTFHDICYISNDSLKGSGGHGR